MSRRLMGAESPMKTNCVGVAIIELYQQILARQKKNENFELQI